MAIKTTAIGDVIDELVTSLGAALSVSVHDGPPVPPPSDLSYLVIGGDVEPNSQAAEMDQEWSGLGAKTRRENMRIRCTAIGRATSFSEARSLAIAVVEDVGEHLAIKPTSETFNAMVGSVDRVTNGPPAQSGVIVKVEFCIIAKSRLPGM